MAKINNVALNTINTAKEVTMEHVSISRGNSKMGKIQSVSTPACSTCRPVAPCYKKCYARRMAARRDNTANAYKRNLRILLNDPEQYWREVEAAIMLSRFFRFHVSGDIPNGEYFSRMIDVAKRNPHCEILCFTKQYEIVNAELDKGTKLPENLHILFSAWPGLEMPNPYELPEAHIIFRNGTTTASDGAKWCGGNCSDCAKTGCGCWTVHEGEQILLSEH